MQGLLTFFTFFFLVIGMTSKEALGEDMYVKGHYQSTALHWAVQYLENEKDLKSFITSKNLNAKDSYGDTPLMKATEYNNLPALKTLLEQGANRSIQNHLGLTPLDWIKASLNEQNYWMGGIFKNEKEVQEVIQILEEYYPKISSLKNKDLAMKLNAKGRNNNTVLHWAVLYVGDEEDIKSFITSENINVQGFARFTPLMQATQAVNVFAVKALLEKGADRDLKDVIGRKALDLAEKLLSNEAQRKTFILEVSHQSHKDYSSQEFIHTTWNERKVSEDLEEIIRLLKDYYPEKEVLSISSPKSPHPTSQNQS